MASGTTQSARSSKRTIYFGELPYHKPADESEILVYEDDLPGMARLQAKNLEHIVGKSLN
jgi:hypothetical protein